MTLRDIYNGTIAGQGLTLPDPSVDLSGTTVIVTGSNAGLGKKLAAKLAAMKPSKIILAVRSASKGEAARQDMVERNPELRLSTIDVWPLDMADFASVKAFSQRAEAELSRLDILVCNAGILNVKFELTKDGWESALQVNGLSTFYLAILLLPLMQRTSATHYTVTAPNTLAKPHLSIVSSGMHYLSTLTPARLQPSILGTMNDPKGFNGDQRYMHTKLLEILFVRELAKRVDVDSQSAGSVLVNAANPGFCHSDLNKAAGEGDRVRRFLERIMKALLARTTEEGARALAWAAISSAEQGGYSTNCWDQAPSSFVISEEGNKTSARLWTEVVDVLTKVDPSLHGGIVSVPASG